MGDEVSIDHFDAEDYRRFQQCLENEMEFVRDLFTKRAFDNSTRRIGYELELCLVDDAGMPAGCNQQILDAAANPLFTYELACYNLEINGNAFDLSADVFERIEQDQNHLFAQVRNQAQSLDLHAGLFGVLPSVSDEHLEPSAYMSDMFRYRLLNDRLMAMRGQPVHLEIHGEEELNVKRNDVMLEALGTSLQLHLQIPFEEAVDTYHASLWSSMAMVGISANSPLVLGKSCWQESRIAIFKQAVDTRNVDEIRNHIVPRVHFSKGYIESFLELFEDNAYYSPILPEVMEVPVANLHHFNLHNGTIWRWIRPILGRSGDNYHLRLELRVAPSGPTLLDSLANMVFYTGLTEGLRHLGNTLTRIPFATLETDFYKVARHGLDAEVHWLDGSRKRLRSVLLENALPMAQQGLDQLGIIDSGHWLEIIEQRASSGQTGSNWILQHWHKYSDSGHLVRDYMAHAELNLPVHRWPQP